MPVTGVGDANNIGNPCRDGSSTLTIAAGGFVLDWRCRGGSGACGGVDLRRREGEAPAGLRR